MTYTFSVYDILLFDEISGMIVTFLLLLVCILYLNKERENEKLEESKGKELIDLSYNSGYLRALIDMKECFNKLVNSLDLKKMEEK